MSFDEQFLKKEKIKYNIIIDENFLHNIYKSDYFKEFINVFFIIEKDLFTILKNAYFYIYYGNELIADILNKFNTEKTLIERISLVLDVLKKLQNFNTFNMNILNDEKSLLIENCLQNHFYKSYENNKVRIKTKSSLSKFRQRLIRQIFDLSEVLIYLSKILNEIPDRNFHALVLYGLQNIFNNDSYLNLPRFLNVVTTLYTYKNERNLYSVNWDLTLFRIICFSKYGKKTNNFCQRIFDRIFDNKKNVSLRFYLVLNSIYIDPLLDDYEKIERNENVLNFFICLIIMLNKVKSSLFGIPYV